MVPGLAVVDANPPVRPAGAAAVAVPFQDLLPASAVEAERMPRLPVTGVAKSRYQGRQGAAGAEEGPLPWIGRRVPFPGPAKASKSFI